MAAPAMARVARTTTKTLAILVLVVKMLKIPKMLLPLKVVLDWGPKAN